MTASNPIADALNQASDKEATERRKLRDQYMAILERIVEHGQASLTDEEVAIVQQVRRVTGFTYDQIEQQVEAMRAVHQQRQLIQRHKADEEQQPDAAAMREEIDRELIPELERLQHRKEELEQQIEQATASTRNRQQAENRLKAMQQQLDDTIRPIYKG